MHKPRENLAMKHRVTTHPILPVTPQEEITFYWNRNPMTARRDEMISSALIANGVYIFSRHHRDGTAQGIFCANGQCSKCMVIANGKPVKSCMTTIKENMIVEAVDGLPSLPEQIDPVELHDIEHIDTDVLIIGGGPAGLSAALELGQRQIKTLIIDDKGKLGGKLVLQTHKFFGSEADSHAGVRGTEIGDLLSNDIEKDPNITVWTGSTVLFIFKDQKVGILRNGVYKLVSPGMILNAAGAREKFLKFPGNTLVGIYGAGAFQTLVNRDLVRPSERLFIIGGGNVGLIAGYHAIQAGIDVVGLAEAMPQCGGYKVHADKLKRLGVPIYTSHSVLSANGVQTVESITITQVDESFQPVPGTEKSFECDTILIAVGLESIDEFTFEARSAGIPVYAAGDASEIAEASSAMFNGKIAGLEIAKDLGADVGEIPESWFEKAEILKAPPGRVVPQVVPDDETGVMPVIHCIQEIPCNPCATVCPTHSITLKGDPIMGIPEYSGRCTGCGLCVAICPGLAITLVDYRDDPLFPTVTVPYEVGNVSVVTGQSVATVDIDGNFLGDMEVIAVKQNKKKKTQLIRLTCPKEIAKRIVSFQIQDETVSKPMEKPVIPVSKPDDSMVCLCERVTVGEVRTLIRKGVTDINQIKAITRVGMGPCGSKNCDNMIRQIFRQEGIPVKDIVPGTRRPLYVEVPLGIFAGDQQGDSSDD
jgi:NADPH-dependent 2,4-dienoyl-CoA reductase/sulfur reductase-like enzyme/Fe-S-cluster-containing hydrogenase component 2/bacterioferritin-associated ferredoxin